MRSESIARYLFSKEKEVVTTGKPVASYSPAIKANGNVYISGQIGMDFSTGKLISDDIVEQTKQALSNLELVINDAGSSLNKIVKVTVMLSDINDYGAMNQVYSKFFSKSTFIRPLSYNSPNEGFLFNSR